MTYDHWKTTNPTDTDLGSAGAARHADDKPAKPAHLTIKTTHVFPPIPIRSFDWHAYYDGYEEWGPSGWGPTEADAIADLLANTEKETD